MKAALLLAALGIALLVGVSNASGRPVGCSAFVTTGGASAVTATSATLSASGDDCGSSDSLSFEYGLTALAYGSTSSGVGTPGTGSFSTSIAISGLAPSTTYHYRAKLDGPSCELCFGGDKTFTTTAAETAAPEPPPANADLSVSENGNQALTVGVQGLAFTITATNHGPDSADAEVDATIPSGGIFSLASASQGACVWGSPPVTQVICRVGTLASGASATIWIVLTPLPTGSLTGSATISGNVADPTPADNVASATATATLPPPPGPPGPPPPPPQPGTFNTIASGTVLVNGQLQPAGQLLTLNSGDVVDVTNGSIALTTSDGSTASFSASQPTFSARQPGPASSSQTTSPVSKFKIEQPAVAGALTALTLVGGDFSVCPPTKTRSFSTSLAPGTVVRSLWGKAKGTFLTRGRVGSAIVRGTVWLTQDRCDGTLVSVREGIVDVFDFTLKKTITLNAGQSYLAKAPKPAKAKIKKHPKPKKA